MLRRTERRRGQDVFVYKLAARGRRFLDMRVSLNVRQQLEFELGIDRRSEDFEVDPE